MSFIRYTFRMRPQVENKMEKGTMPILHNVAMLV